MSIVIGATTTVVFPYGDCVVSANWGYNPNVQRLYCLGSWDVFDTIEKPTETFMLQYMLLEVQLVCYLLVAVLTLLH